MINKSLLTEYHDYLDLPFPFGPVGVWNDDQPSPSQKVLVLISGGCTFIMVPVVDWVTGLSLTPHWCGLWPPPCTESGASCGTLLPCLYCSQWEGIWDGKRGWSKYHKSAHKPLLSENGISRAWDNVGAQGEKVYRWGAATPSAFWVLSWCLFTAVHYQGWSSLLWGFQAWHEGQAGNENWMSGVSWCQHPLLQGTKIKKPHR